MQSYNIFKDIETNKIFYWLKCRDSIMTLKFLLFVVFLGNVLAEEDHVVNEKNSASLSKESKIKASLVQNPISKAINSVVVYKRYAQDQLLDKHKEKKLKGKQEAIKLMKNINKLAAEKREKTIMLGKKIKSQLLILAKTNTKNILNLVKMSSDQFTTLKEKALASQNITTESAQFILNLVNVTIEGQRKSLQESAETIRDLSKSFITNLKKFADFFMEKISSALKEKKNVEEAKGVLQNELKMITKISVACSHKLRLSYSVSAKEVMDLTNKGVDLTLETAENQIRKFEVLKSDNEVLNGYIDFSSKAIYNLVKNTADKYTELASDCLQRLKKLSHDKERSVLYLALLELKFGKALIEDNDKRRSELQWKIDETLSKFEDEGEGDFNKFIDSIVVSTDSIMLEATKKVEAIQECPPTNSSCLSNFGGSTD